MTASQQLMANGMPAEARALTAADAAVGSIIRRLTPRSRWEYSQAPSQLDAAERLLLHEAAVQGPRPNETSTLESVSAAMARGATSAREITIADRGTLNAVLEQSMLISPKQSLFGNFPLPVLTSFLRR